MKITDILNEMTSAGAIATVAQPMGKMIRRNKKKKTAVTEAVTPASVRKFLKQFDKEYNEDIYGWNVGLEKKEDLVKKIVSGDLEDYAVVRSPHPTKKPYRNPNGIGMLVPQQITKVDPYITSKSGKQRKHPEFTTGAITDAAYRLSGARSPTSEDFKSAKETFAIAVKEFLSGKNPFPLWDDIEERKLSKSEIKQRDDYADDLPDAEFKKRYGADWEAVKYGTATNMAKKKTKESVQLDEYRSTNILGFMSGLRKHPDVEKIVDIVSQADGQTALVRTKDGNAYEIQVRQAGMSQHPSIQQQTKRKDS